MTVGILGTWPWKSEIFTWKGYDRWPEPWPSSLICGKKSREWRHLVFYRCGPHGCCIAMRYYIHPEWDPSFAGSFFIEITCRPYGEFGIWLECYKVRADKWRLRIKSQDATDFRLNNEYLIWTLHPRQIGHAGGPWPEDTVDSFRW